MKYNKIKAKQGKYTYSTFSSRVANEGGREEKGVLTRVTMCAYDVIKGFRQR